MKSLISTLYLTLWLSICQYSAATAPSIQDILTVIQGNLMRPPVAMEVETTTYRVDPNGLKPPQIIQVEKANYRKDGQRVDIVTDRYTPNEEGKLVFDNFSTRHFCNGYVSFSSLNNLFYIQPSQAIQTDASFVASNGNVLDGYFGPNNNDGHWTEIFNNEPDNIVSEDSPEKINGHLCFVVKADLSCGNYTLWLDPEQKYTLRKAHILFDPDDRVWGKPLKESSMRLKCYGPDIRRYYTAIEINLDAVETKMIDGKVIPVEGTYSLQYTFDDGYQIDTQTKIRRHNIAFNPDFKALGAFEVDVPEGTVFTEYLEGGNYKKYIWSQGKMVPEVKN
jgi:hypothetical protein